MNRSYAWFAGAGVCLAMAAWASVAGADEVIWRNALYADVTDLAVDKAQVTFRLPNGTNVSKPIGEVQEIRLSGQDGFNQAEKALRAGGFARAIGLYEAALKAPHPAAQEPLMRARADWARHCVQAAAQALEARRKEFEGGGQLSLDVFAAKAAAQAATRPAPVNTDPPAVAPAPCVLWRLSVVSVEVTGQRATLKARSPNGSIAQAIVPAGPVQALKPGDAVDLAGRVETVECGPLSACLRLTHAVAVPAPRAASRRAAEDVVFILDNSGSMLGLYDDVEPYAMAMLLSLWPEDRLAVVLAGEHSAAPPIDGLAPADPAMKLMWISHILAAENAARGGDRGSVAVGEALSALERDRRDNRPRRIALLSDGDLSNPPRVREALFGQGDGESLRIDTHVFGSDQAGAALMADIARMTNGQCTRPGQDK